MGLLGMHVCEPKTPVCMALPLTPASAPCAELVPSLRDPLGNPSPYANSSAHPTYCRNCNATPLQLSHWDCWLHARLHGSPIPVLLLTPMPAVRPVRTHRQLLAAVQVQVGVEGEEVRHVAHGGPGAGWGQGGRAGGSVKTAGMHVRRDTVRRCGACLDLLQLFLAPLLCCPVGKCPKSKSKPAHLLPRTWCKAV